jgi:hypothetical protein
MNTKYCGEEQRVLEALHSGRWAGAWGKELRRHVANCAVCTEVVLVAEALRREDKLAQAEAQPPSAGLVWWKAQLVARRAAADRAAQPIAVTERVAQTFGVLSAIGLTLAHWPRILGWIRSAHNLVGLPGSGPAGADWAPRLLQGWGGQSPSYLLVASAGAFLVLLGFAVYVVWREE